MILGLANRNLNAFPQLPSRPRLSFSGSCVSVVSLPAGVISKTVPHTGTASSSRCRKMTSVERVTLLKQLAAKVVAPGAIILDQFKNPANPEIHRKTTAIEIWEDTQSGVDYLISAVGTGGTITGVRRRGSQAAQVQCPCHCRGARQRRYPFRRYGGQSSDPRHRYRIHCGHHEPPIIDAVIAVSDEDAFSCARRLAREEGYLPGFVRCGAARGPGGRRPERERRENNRRDPGRHRGEVCDPKLVCWRELKGDRLRVWEVAQDGGSLFLVPEMNICGTTLGRPLQSQLGSDPRRVCCSRKQCKLIQET